MQAAGGTSLNTARAAAGDDGPPPGTVPAGGAVRLPGDPGDAEPSTVEGDPAGGEVRDGSGRGRPRRRRVGVLVAVALAVYVLDVVSKIVVVATLSHHPPIRLLGGLLTLRLVRNGGAAFSIGTSMTVVFTVIAVGVIVYILRAARRLRSASWAVALGLLLGGAAGNLTDRLFRSPAPFEGHVVDWIELPHWPVFNLADTAICCGGALFVLLAARGVRLDGTRDGERRDAGVTDRDAADPLGRPAAGRLDPTQPSSSERSRVAGSDDERRSTLCSRPRRPRR